LRDEHHVVIVGGGFAGLHTALGLKRAPVQVTLIDRRNFHLFQPLLYQVATGSLSPGDIAAPLRVVLRRCRNVRTIMGEVIGFDVQQRQVFLNDGLVTYDTLVLAPGSRQNYFGHEEWARIAPGLKTIEDSTHARSQVLSSLEAAERQGDPAELGRYLTFVIIGAGPTGVEMAGAVSEIVRDSLRRDFRRIRNVQPRILLVEMLDRVLPPYPPDLSEKAAKSLQSLGVELMLNTRVVDIEPMAIVVERDGRTERIPTRSILWTAGTLASPLGKALAERVGVQLDRSGRVYVEPDLTVPGHPEIFVIGDLANVPYGEGGSLPALGAVAQQQGQYVARAIRARLSGKPVRPFRYRNYGEMATIGRARAVANFKWIKLSGFVAWLLWLFVHLMKLVGFENRIMVFVQWAWNYTTFNRTARLITGDDPLPFKRSDSD
jgi:NADH dehydrogenase